MREPLLRQLAAAGFVFQKYCSSQNGDGYWCGSGRCRLVKHCRLSWQSLTAAFWRGRWMWSGQRASCAIPDVPGDWELWSGCEVRRRDGNGETGLFQMPLETDSCQSHSDSCIYVCCLWTWILVCSEAWELGEGRGRSCGLRDAPIKLASQCCLNIVDNSVKFLFMRISVLAICFFWLPPF